MQNILLEANILYALASESCDDSGYLRPCLRLRFDKRRMGRLYQLIDRLNGLELPSCHALQHPGERVASPEGP